MYLIVGLGNPGKQYENTRHNLGFRVLDLLTDNTEWENKYQSLFIKTEDAILLKPQTFMNLSGKAVKEVSKYYPDAKLVVVHDELDLPLGTVKLMKDLSSAGHNGIKSIIEELNTQDFIRLRLGIANPELKGQVPAEDFVLQKFDKSEESLVTESLERAKDIVDSLLRDGFELTQSKYNG
ncbi:MAG: aminoacyl-tRNA hydrolase [Acidobacteriaceae bacterium]